MEEHAELKSIGISQGWSNLIRILPEQITLPPSQLLKLCIACGMLHTADTSHRAVTAYMDTTVELLTQIFDGGQIFLCQLTQGLWLQ